MSIAAPKICLMGDSTMGTIDIYLHPMTKGIITDLSVDGGNTAGQKAQWLSLTDGQRASFDYVLIQIGLNDLDTGGKTAAELIPEIQELFDTVRLGIKSSCVVISSTMTPARAAIGDAAYAQWLIVNEAYEGDGATPFDGDVFASYHTEKLNDGSGNLDPKYDDGSGVHANLAGREVCADDYREFIDFAYYY